MSGNRNKGKHTSFVKRNLLAGVGSEVDLDLWKERRTCEISLRQQITTTKCFISILIKLKRFQHSKTGITLLVGEDEGHGNA